MTSTLKMKCGTLLSTMDAEMAMPLMGVFVTREHVRHNKSGIAHRGRTGINH
jgi:hypothetical protein